MPAPMPAELFLQQFLVAHGELMSGDDLRRALGFRSERSFLRAFRAQELPVATFCLPKRRGQFARTRDVAIWLSSLGRSK